MPTKLTSYLTPTTSTGELVKINYKYTSKDGLNYGPLQDDNIDIPSATTTNAGAMSAIDKGRLDDLYDEFGSIQNPGDKLNSLPKNLVTGVDATSRNATSVTINYKQSDLSAASNSYANPITKSQTIPAATQSAAGVMTATDKQNLDVNIPNRITNLDNRVTTEVNRLEELIESSSSEITNDLNVEIQARKDGDTQLQTNINNLQSTMNTELAKKVGKVTVAGSGNTLTVNVSQDAKPAENVYVFTITPNTYDAPYSSASFIPRTVSTKNGSNIGYSLTSGGTDWVVVSTTGKITVEILKNTTSNTRSTTLVFTQNESGKTQSIKITQSGYTPTYTFNVTPTNLSVTAAETNETLTVNSYKTVLKSDGSKTTESLNYEFSSNASWVNAARTTTNTTYITVAQNLTTNQRSAKITLTQAESGAQVFTNVIQAGQQVVDNKLTLTSITYSTGYLFPSGQTPVEGEIVYLGFIVPNTFTWKTSNGLAINRGTIYAGNIGNIYVRENDRYKLVKSFQLQTGDQTISF